MALRSNYTECDCERVFAALVLEIKQTKVVFAFAVALCINDFSCFIWNISLRILPSHDCIHRSV